MDGNVEGQPEDNKVEEGKKGERFEGGPEVFSTEDILRNSSPRNFLQAVRDRFVLLHDEEYHHPSHDEDDQNPTADSVPLRIVPIDWLHWPGRIGCWDVPEPGSVASEKLFVVNWGGT